MLSAVPFWQNAFFDRVDHTSSQLQQQMGRLRKIQAHPSDAYLTVEQVPVSQRLDGIALSEAEEGPIRGFDNKYIPLAEAIAASVAVNGYFTMKGSSKLQQSC